MRASETFTQLVDLNQLATNVIGMAYRYVQSVPTFNFGSYEARIDEDLNLSNAMLGNVTDTFKEVSIIYLLFLSRCFLLI